MFQWVKTLLHTQAESRPIRTSDDVFTETIEQLIACRKHLVLLIEETRTARQLLDVTESTLQRAHKEAKRELYLELHGSTDGFEMPPLEPEVFTSERRQR